MEQVSTGNEALDKYELTRRLYAQSVARLRTEGDKSKLLQQAKDQMEEAYRFEVLASTKWQKDWAKAETKAKRWRAATCILGAVITGLIIAP